MSLRRRVADAVLTTDPVQRMRLSQAGLAMLLHTALALAVSPYISGERRPPAPVAEQLAPLAQRLQAEGFTVVGRHLPARLAPAAPHAHDGIVGAGGEELAVPAPSRGRDLLLGA